MTHCVHPSKGFVLFDNVVLHVLILFVLLSALFVFYIQKLTSEGFNTEFSNIVDEIVSPDMINKIFFDGFSL
jgi:thiosulfate reductase cytochrome b subunit